MSAWSRLSALLVLALLSMAVGPAAASLSRAQLDAVGVERQIGVRLPLSLAFRDRQGREAKLATLLDGRPTLLMFADYQCRMICGTALNVLAGLLGELAAERPGAYRVAVVGLDPKDGPALAEAAYREQFGGPVDGAPEPLFLTGGEAAVRGLADTAGYHYAYDAERGEYAHPVVLIALDGEGRVVRYLPALAATGRDLWLALGDAGAPSDDLVQGLRSLCYRFDPASGTYTSVVARVLPLACGGTVVAIAGGLLGLSLRQRRRRRQGASEQGQRADA